MIFNKNGSKLWTDEDMPLMSARELGKYLRIWCATHWDEAARLGRLCDGRILLDVCVGTWEDNELLVY
jgi:hypothetical protein